MDSNCESKHCRIKLREYFVSTSKLYDDIGSLEADIKEKEDFVQKLKKGRNDYQNEAIFLKKNNAELLKEIDVLVEKNERFENNAKVLKKTKAELKVHKDKLKLIEEEFDIDYELAAKVRDTEDKLRNELAVKGKIILTMEKKKEISDKLIKSLQLENEVFKNSLASEKTENKELKQKLEIVRNKWEESSDLTETTIEDQRVAIIDLKNKNETAKKKISDLEDEIQVKTKEIINLEQQSQKASLTNSASSLKEELQQVQIFECDRCSSNFTCVQELNTHSRTMYEERLLKKLALLTKMNNLQKVLSGQRINVASSILDLKKKEFQASLTCSCQGFCGITHLKHNFKKSKADEISEKVQRLSNGEQNHIRSDHENLGTFRKCYKCNLCDREFSKQGHLKAHKKRKHTTREKKLVNIEYPFLSTNDEVYFKNKANDVDNVEPGHSESEESIDDDSEENEVYSLSNSLGSSSKYSEGRDSSEGGENSESGEV